MLYGVGTDGFAPGRPCLDQVRLRRLAFCHTLVERSCMNPLRAISKFLLKTRHQKIVLLSSLPTRVWSRFYYPWIFGSFGPGSLLFKPVLLGSPEYVHIGRDVLIRPGARLEVIPTGSGEMP